MPIAPVEKPVADLAIPRERSRELRRGGKVLEISLAHDGAFGSEASPFSSAGGHYRSMATVPNRSEQRDTEIYAARELSSDGNINAAITTPATAARMPNAINTLDVDFKVATRIASASRAAVVATTDASSTS